MKGLLSTEEYLDNHRSEYYQALEDKDSNVTDYLEFMLEAIAETAEKVKLLILEKEKGELLKESSMSQSKILSHLHL